MVIASVSEEEDGGEMQKGQVGLHPYYKPKTSRSTCFCWNLLPLYLTQPASINSEWSWVFFGSYNRVNTLINSPSPAQNSCTHLFLTGPTEVTSHTVSDHFSEPAIENNT